jgi:hypothetical protein
MSVKSGTSRETSRAAIAREYLRRARRHKNSRSANLPLSTPRTLKKANSSMTEISSTSPPSQYCDRGNVIDLELLDAAADHRDIRRAELDWRPQDDRSHRATMSGIAPPGSATPSMATLHQRGHTEVGVRVLSSNPTTTKSSRVRLGLRLFFISVIVAVYLYCTA